MSLTISSDACLPSIKVRGIALGVRISYLETNVKMFVQEKWRWERGRVTEGDEMLLICWLKTYGAESYKSTPLSELLEWDAVGETLSADTDSLQNTVTPQLVQNEVRCQFTSLRRHKAGRRKVRYFSMLSSFVCLVWSWRSHPLLMVGDNAPQEVGVGVPECGHQLGQRLFVELTNGPKHPLLRLQPSGSKRNGSAALSCWHLVQTHNPVDWMWAESRVSVFQKLAAGMQLHWHLLVQFTMVDF